MPSKDITFCDDTSCMEVHCPRNWTEWQYSEIPVSVGKFKECCHYGKVDDSIKGVDK